MVTGPHRLAGGYLAALTGPKVADWRRRWAAAGVVALLALAVTGTIGAEGYLASVAFISLTIASGLSWVELRQTPGHRRLRPSLLHARNTPRHVSRPAPIRITRWEGPVAVIATMLITTGAVQTWFRPGTAIAGGDIAPPNGTAWLDHLFAAWTWSGGDLGRPPNLETQLPWGAVLLLVHVAGGSSALAQRFWLTFLFAGASLSALWLLHLLTDSWTAAAAGALLFCFSPFVLSVVGPSAVYLTALFLVVVEPAIILSVCSARWLVRTGVVALVATVPFIGYAWQNPPMVLALVASAATATTLAIAHYGRPAVYRAAKLFFLALPLALAVSLYWLVPSLEQIRFDALSQLATLTNWTWTESRSTLANAFWLNTSWAWPIKEYTPYGGAYSHLPLSLLRYAFPLLGFVALTFNYQATPKDHRRLATAALGATGALLLIFLSTGTRPPGAPVFDALYRLPYGWLLQGPGRFLILVAVGYATMTAVSIERWIGYLQRHSPLLHPSSFTRHVLANLTLGTAIVTIGAIAPGYPLAFGSVVHGANDPPLPSSHVRVPKYWPELANYLNRPSTPPGAVLVMPPDPFYQMAYRWGYHGSDAFITDMLRRGVLDPAGQGWAASREELLSAVRQVASSLLGHQFNQANSILQALGTRDILDRGDISTTFPGLSVDSPRALSAALRADPAITLVHRSGPLLLYRLRSAQGLASPRSGVPYVTAQTSHPNPLELALLTKGTVIIEHRPIPGVPAVVQIPSLTSFRLQHRSLSYVTALPPRPSYLASTLPAAGKPNKTTRLHIGLARKVDAYELLVRPNPQTARMDLYVSEQLGGNELPNGHFTSGPWETIGNCDNAPGVKANVRADIVDAPGAMAGRALQLSATAEIACESQPIVWRGGSVLLTLSARSLSGNGPAICLWQVGPNRCASTADLEDSRTWRTYRQVITPAPGTQALSLFLYAYGPDNGTTTVDDYAAITVYPVHTSPPVAIMATGGSRPRRLPVLTVADSTFSTVWATSRDARHVLVDGMTNGWLTASTKNILPYETIGPTLHYAFVTSWVGLSGTLLLAVSIVAGQVPGAQGTTRVKRRVKRRTSLRPMRSDCHARGPLSTPTRACATPKSPKPAPRSDRAHYRISGVTDPP